MRESAVCTKSFNRILFYVRKDTIFFVGMSEEVRGCGPQPPRMIPCCPSKYEVGTRMSAEVRGYSCGFDTNR